MCDNTEKSKYLAGKMGTHWHGWKWKPRMIWSCLNCGHVNEGTNLYNPDYFTAEGRQVLLTACLDKDKGIFWDAFTKWFGKRKGFSGRNIQQKVMAHFFVFIPELADAVYAYLKERDI